MTATLHEMLTETIWPDRSSVVPTVITATCTCGGWSASRPGSGPANTLTRAHRDHQREARRDEREQARAEALAWHARTGHCFSCGQPGDWCQCVHPCRCASAHATGSGIGRDPAALFTTAAAIEQDTLL